ncbi:MAG TPA: CAP domain-containing protein [Patescibacteria group bacterium]|nr:CAP domain-containing protein [Patescibacteria group bacterium]
MSPRSPRSIHASILLVALLVAFLGFAVGPAAHPAPASASTASYMESLIVKWVNNARANRGVAPLKVGSLLVDLAGDRAVTISKTQTLAHPSCLSCVFRSYGISFSMCGEVLAWTSYPWGYQAARNIFNGWKGSPSHWSILMSPSFHRIGVGVAYRSASHTTWAAGELKS